MVLLKLKVNIHILQFVNGETDGYRVALADFAVIC